MRPVLSSFNTDELFIEISASQPAGASPEKGPKQKKKKGPPKGVTPEQFLAIKIAKKRRNKEKKKEMRREAKEGEGEKQGEGGEGQRGSSSRPTVRGVARFPTGPALSPEQVRRPMATPYYAPPAYDARPPQLRSAGSTPAFFAGLQQRRRAQEFQLRAQAQAPAQTPTPAPAPAQLEANVSYRVGKPKNKKKQDGGKGLRQKIANLENVVESMREEEKKRKEREREEREEEEKRKERERQEKEREKAERKEEGEKEREGGNQIIPSSTQSFKGVVGVPTGPAYRQEKREASTKQTFRGLLGVPTGPAYVPEQSHRSQPLRPTVRAPNLFEALALQRQRARPYQAPTPTPAPAPAPTPATDPVDKPTEEEMLWQRISNLEKTVERMEAEKSDEEYSGV